MKTLFWLAFCVVLALMAGCAGGIQSLTPEQLKQMPGMTACSRAQTPYGNVSTVVVAVDDVRKNATNKFKVTIAPDCTISVEGDVGVAAPTTAASGAKP